LWSTKKSNFGYNLTSSLKQPGAMMSKQEIIIGEVIQQIKTDISDGQSDALYALLMSVSTNQLLGFLPESTQQYLAQVDR